jgi:hypothetical protein
VLAGWRGGGTSTVCGVAPGLAVERSLVLVGESLGTRQRHDKAWEGAHPRCPVSTHAGVTRVTRATRRNKCKRSPG